MGRPAQPKSSSVQLGVLSRMLQQVEIDERLPVARRKRIVRLIGNLMTEFQQDLGQALEQAS